MGQTALMSNLSCDSVIAGAFFPQPESRVPEEEVTQHAGDHMVAPPRIFSYLVMVHPQVGFGFLETLLHGPADPGEPDKGLQPGGSTGVRDEVGVCTESDLPILPHYRLNLKDRITLGEVRGNSFITFPKK